MIKFRFSVKAEDTDHIWKFVGANEDVHMLFLRATRSPTGIMYIYETRMHEELRTAFVISVPLISL